MSKPQKFLATYEIIKVLPYLLMMNTDSGSLEFNVIAEDPCVLWLWWNGNEDVLLRIFLDKEIHLRLDLSGKFFDKFGKRNEAIRKQIELYKFENIEHGIICTICVNPKEY